MRLIDVEQTLWEMRFEESKYEYEENYGYRQAEEFIKQQPTVEAIPIDWIENWKRGKTSIEQVVADKIMMDYKYRDWEKENETN